MTIKDCIFAIESLTHLQGNEAELLPLVEAAKSEHAALRNVVQFARNLALLLNEDKDGGFFLCEEARDVVDSLDAALEKLR